MTVRNAESEQSPMSAWDEYPIHQIPAPLRVVGTSDVRAYERYWFSAADMSGEFVLMVGMGFYPNLGTVDGYVAWNQGGRHTTVRVHRYLDDDRRTISCGPLSFEIVEAFKEVRLVLAENEHGLSMDIRFHDTKRPVFADYPLPGPIGRPPTRTCGYESFGRVEGQVVLDGVAFDLQPETTLGSRDHHWGERNGVGGPHFADNRVRSGHFLQWVEFSDWSIWGMRCLLNPGDPRKGAIAVLRTEQELTFDPLTDHFIGGVVTNYLANGEVKKITYQQLGDRVIYLRTGMYMGPDFTGTPDENYFHGTDVGVTTHRVTYDVTDPKTRIRLGGFEDHLVRATCDGEVTVGLIESKNPVPFEWVRDGKPGYRMAANTSSEQVEQSE